MRRGTVRAANMSPVPEKKNGRRGVSILKRRGLWSDVAVDPMIVMCSTSSSSFGDGGASGLEGSEAVQPAGCEVSGLSDSDGICCVALAAGCEVSGFNSGVCWPEAVAEAGFEGARDGIVWLSRVSRREVIITWGTR